MRARSSKRSAKPWLIVNRGADAAASITSPKGAKASAVKGSVTSTRRVLLIARIMRPVARSPP